MQRAAGISCAGGTGGLSALWVAVVAIGWGSVGTAWAADPATPAELARGKQLFVSVQPACAVCHTLQAAGAQGEVGPVLDEIKPNADRVLRALRNGIGAMPSFAEKMTEQDMQAVARFVAQSTGAAP